jgi:septal ring factor EnvC (AmiA/AmiB activator)
MAAGVEVNGLVNEREQAAIILRYAAALIERLTAEIAVHDRAREEAVRDLEIADAEIERQAAEIERCQFEHRGYVAPPGSMTALRERAEAAEARVERLRAVARAAGNIGYNVGQWIGIDDKRWPELQRSLVDLGKLADAALAALQEGDLE